MRIQPRQNYPGISGWIWVRKYRLERYLYLLHRITGLVLVVFGVIYLVMIAISIIHGQDILVSTIELVHKLWFKVVISVFIYHTLNGFRLILQELGFTLGKPTQPIYPYQDSLNRKRSLTLSILMLIIILTLITLFVIFTGDI